MVKTKSSIIYFALIFFWVNNCSNAISDSDTESETSFADAKVEFELKGEKFEEEKNLDHICFVKIVSPEEGDFVNSDFFVILEVSPNVISLDLPNELVKEKEKTYAIVDSSGIKDGEHLIKVVATTDSFEECSDSVKVVVDNTPPVLKIVDPEDKIENALSIKIKAVDETAGVESIEFFVFDFTTGKVVFKDKVYSEVVVKSINFDTFESGYYLLKAIARDRAGNHTEANKIFVKDLPPSITIISPENGKTYENSVEVKIKVCDDFKTLENISLFIDFDGEKEFSLKDFVFKAEDSCFYFKKVYSAMYKSHAINMAVSVKATDINGQTTEKGVKCIVASNDFNFDFKICKTSLYKECTQVIKTNNKILKNTVYFKIKITSFMGKNLKTKILLNDDPYKSFEGMGDFNFYVNTNNFEDGSLIKLTLLFSYEIDGNKKEENYDYYFIVYNNSTPKCLSWNFASPFNTPFIYVKYFSKPQKYPLPLAMSEWENRIYSVFTERKENNNYDLLFLKYYNGAISEEKILSFEIATPSFVPYVTRINGVLHVTAQDKLNGSVTYLRKEQKVWEETILQPYPTLSSISPFDSETFSQLFVTKNNEIVVFNSGLVDSGYWFGIMDGITNEWEFVDPNSVFPETNFYWNGETLLFDTIPSYHTCATNKKGKIYCVLRYNDGESPGIKTVFITYDSEEGWNKTFLPFLNKYKIFVTLAENSDVPEIFVIEDEEILSYTLSDSGEWQKTVLLTEENDHLKEMFGLQDYYGSLGSQLRLFVKIDDYGRIFMLVHKRKERSHLFLITDNQKQTLFSDVYLYAKEHPFILDSNQNIYIPGCYEKENDTILCKELYFIRLPCDKYF